MQPSPGLPGVRRAAAALAGALATGALLAACSAPTEPTEFDIPPAPATQRLDLAGRDDLVDRHPNGAVLQVRSIQVRPRSIAVEVSVINGYVDRISLTNSGMFSDSWLWLVDDLGNSYRYDGRAPLGIGPGEELVGALVFLGSMAEDAGTVALKSNVTDPAEPIDFRERDIDEDRPAFFVEGIPVP